MPLQTRRCRVVRDISTSWPRASLHGSVLVRSRTPHAAISLAESRPNAVPDRVGSSRRPTDWKVAPYLRYSLEICVAWPGVSPTRCATPLRPQGRANRRTCPSATSGKSAIRQRHRLPDSRGCVQRGANSNRGPSIPSQTRRCSGVRYVRAFWPKSSLYGAVTDRNRSVHAEESLGESRRLAPASGGSPLANNRRPTDWTVSPYSRMAPITCIAWSRLIPTRRATGSSTSARPPRS